MKATQPKPKRKLGYDYYGCEFKVRKARGDAAVSSTAETMIESGGSLADGRAAVTNRRQRWSWPDYRR